MNEYNDASQRAKDEINRVLQKPEDTIVPICEAAGNDALSKVVELADPIIYTDEHVIEIPGLVYILSVRQLVKTMQMKYVAGKDNLADIALEIIETGDSARKGELAKFKTADMMAELRLVHQMIPGISADSVVILAKFVKDEPIVPVTEWMVDGMHANGKVLQAIGLPMVIEAGGAGFKFESPTGVNVNDINVTGARHEKNGVFKVRRFFADITKIEDNTVEVRKGITVPHGGDIVNYLGVILFVAGFVMIVATRLRLAEMGALPFIAGIVLLLFRWTPLGADYFSNRLLDIKGDAPIKMAFYGELK